MRGGKLSPESNWKRCLTWTKKYYKTVKCSNCSSLFVPIFDRHRKTCSDECLFDLKSKTLAKRHKNKKWSSDLGSLAGRASARKRVLRSKDEIELFGLCEKEFDNVKHNVPVADGWDADIIIHDNKTVILWNGPWHYKEMGFQNHSLKQVQNRDRIKIKKFQNAGWRVLVFEDRFFTPSSAFKRIIAG